LGRHVQRLLVHVQVARHATVDDGVRDTRRYARGRAQVSLRDALQRGMCAQGPGDGVRVAMRWSMVAARAV